MGWGQQNGQRNIWIRFLAGGGLVDCERDKGKSGIEKKCEKINAEE